MTDFYVRSDLRLKDYESDPNVIGNTQFFKFLTGVKYAEDSFVLPTAPEWYPRCNSYYPYTEDVDAVNRVNHLVASKRYLASFTNLETESKSGDEYDLYEAQMAFLRSKPATFLILGKPGIGEQRLGKLLADYWKCVYIDPEILVDEEIKSGSRAGQCIEFNLRCGRAVAVDVILRLLEKRVNSKSAQHRGFVVCGFPLIRNDMYQDDPVSSESAVFTAQEIFEEIVEPALASSQIIRNVSRTSQVSKVSEPTPPKEDDDESDEDFSEQKGEFEESDAKQADEVGEKAAPPDPTQNLSVDIGSATSAICKITNIGTNYSEQLMFVFSLCHQPLIILYIMCQNADVIKKHENYRYDLNTHEIINLQRDQSENIVYTIYTKTPGFNNEELPDDFLDGLGERTLGLSSSELRYLTYLPRDFSGNIAAQLEQYRYEALPIIEKRVLLHDPQYFIKLDGRISPYRMFNIVKAKLRILPIPRVAVPEKLIDPFVPTGGEADQINDVNFDDKTPEECFEDFRKRKVVNRMFKWKWSKWGALCPVAMKQGVYIPGSPKYAMAFLDRLYFLSTEDAVTKFSRNPRPFLLPPAPKPSCKIFVIGPKSSGKTAVANCFGLLLNGKVLDPFRIQQEYIDHKRKEFLEKVRSKAINAALIVLEQMRKNEYERVENMRLVTIPKWLAAQTLLIEERLLLARLMQTGHMLETTAFPLPSMQRTTIDPAVVSKYKDQYEALKQKFVDIGLSCFSDVDLCEKLSENPKQLNDYLPDDLKYPTPLPQPVSVFDEFVTEQADAAVDKAYYDSFEMSLEDIVDMYVSSIKEAEEKNRELGETHGGWVVDGVPPNIELIEMVSEKCKPDDILVLRDSTKTFLVDRYRVKGQNEFKDYRSFFERLGKPHIASRSPSLTSTMSYKTRIAREIVDDILDDQQITGQDFFSEEEEGEGDEFVDVDYFAIHATRFALKQYEKELEEFDMHCDDLISYFVDNDVPFVEVDVANKSLTQLMTEVIKCVNTKFTLLAHEFTPAERIQEIEDFGEPEILGEGLGEDEDEPKPADIADSFSQNRRLGNTNCYCPVTFHDHWVLWTGKEEYAAKYDDALYLMCSEDALDDFVKAPQEYLDNKPRQSFPPPRICIVGVASSGKTTLAKYLCKSLGLYYVSYESRLKRVFDYGGEVDLDYLIRTNKDSPEAVSLENYLNSDQPLPDELLEKINLKSIWFSEPIKSGGFVLDGYPKRPSDAEYMKQHVIIPDIILELSVTDVSVNKRQVLKQIEEWKVKTANAQEEQDKLNRRIADEWEEKRKMRISELKEIKRQARFQAKMQEKMETEVNEEATESALSTDRSQVSYNSVAEEADMEEVLREVAAELPEPVFQDNWETLEEATQRIINQAETSFVADTEIYRLLKDFCDTELIDWALINADLSEEKVCVQAMRFVDKIKFRNRSFFERCYDVTLELAENLLESGYCFLSRFGRACPVQLYEKINPVLMFPPLEQKFEIYPILHRSYVYFLAGKENRSTFCRNPLKYTMQSHAQFPLVPFRVAVIGPPKSGKTVLCERFKRDLGLKYVSIGQAGRYVLRFLPYSSLAKSLETVLRNGWELTSEMTMRCVEAMAFDGKSITQGLVFDGFPNSVEDVRHLADVGLVPHLVIDLQADVDDIHGCLAGDQGKRGLPTFSRHFIDHRHDEWSKNAETFRAWLDKEYQVLAKLPIQSSVWGIWNSAYDLATSVLFEMKHYYKNCNFYIGLRLANMQVTPSEFLERQSSYKHYCPCCLHFKNLLVTSGEPPDRTGLVQFHSNYYWLCNEHIDEFIDNPEIYLSPYNRNKLPEHLPIQKVLTEEPVNCYESGICIVCYWENQPERVLRDGSRNLASTYRDITYLFDSKSCMDKFMAEPWKYFSKTVNFKQAKPYASLKLDDLPVLGMLEQYVVRNVVKAVTNTGVIRPVLAGLSVEQSAALNIGLHLKVNNANTPKAVLPVYEKAASLFKERRLSFVNTLARMKAAINPYLYYEEPLPKLILPGDLESSERKSSEDESKEFCEFEILDD